MSMDIALQTQRDNLALRDGILRQPSRPHGDLDDSALHEGVMCRPRLGPALACPERGTGA